MGCFVDRCDITDGASLPNTGSSATAVHEDATERVVDVTSQYHVDVASQSRPPGGVPGPAGRQVSLRQESWTSEVASQRIRPSGRVAWASLPSSQQQDVPLEDDVLYEESSSLDDAGRVLHCRYTIQYDREFNVDSKAEYSS